MGAERSFWSYKSLIIMLLIAGLTVIFAPQTAFATSGVMAASVASDGASATFDEQEAVKTGFVKEKGKTYFYNSKGKR